MHFYANYLRRKRVSKDKLGGASSSSVGLGESPEAEVRSYANYEPLNSLKKLELRHYGNYYKKNSILLDRGTFVLI